MAHLIPDNLKSRSDMPLAIRRIANAFLVGLDEDVVCWYEAQFDTEGLRPDFVVLLPDRGICVLEVLDVADQDVLGAIRGSLRLARDGRECEVSSPLQRAEHLAQLLRHRLQNESRLDSAPLKVVAAAVFPALTREEFAKKGMEKICPAEKSIFKEEIDAGAAGNETVLMRAFTRIAGPAEFDCTLTADHVKVIRGLIQPDIVIDAIVSSAHEAPGAEESEKRQLQIFGAPDQSNEEDVIRVMDLQQETLAKSLGDGHRVIRGVAGSGKTLVLVYRAKLLAQCWPRRRYLLACYTKSLASELRHFLRDYPNVDVVTLDRLMYDVITRAGYEHPGYENGGDAAAELAVKLLSESGADKPVPERQYHGVFLDEAQDFGTPQLQFATRLLREDSEDLVVVADAAQNIYRRKFSWKQAGIQARGRTRVLRVNYRNTREILEFAYVFLLTNSQLRPDEVPDQDDENAVIPPESARRSGALPELHVVPSTQAEVEKCLEVVLSWYEPGMSPKSIAVLYPSSWERGFNKAGALLEALQKAGLPVFWLGDTKDKSAKGRFAHVKEPIVLSPIHSSKGLEFADVVLCGVQRDSDPPEVNRKLAYVGMTRATTRLAVVTKGGYPLVDDLKLAVERVSEGT